VTRRLVLTYLAITVVVLAVLEIPLAFTYAGRERARSLTALERDAWVIADAVEDALEGRPGLDPQVVADDYQARTGGRAVVVDASGVARADSDAEVLGADRNFSTRPEFAAALAGGVARGERDSETLGSSLLYAAVPVSSAGQAIGAVRLTVTGDELRDRTVANTVRLAVLAVAVLVTVGALGWLLARSVLGPLERVRSGVSDLAGGNLRRRVGPLEGPPELRRLGAEVDAMADRLATLVQAQGAFVADASHQLRSPLAALRLRLENAEDALAAGDDTAVGADLAAASDEVVRLGHLVDGLLALARSGVDEPKRVVLDAAAVVRGRVATWEALAAEHGVRLVVDGAAPAWVRAVEGALDQQLDNLIANALDVDGVRTITVAVAAAVAVRGAGPVVEVAVVDDGPGMSDAELARATDRFWRGPRSRPGGSGLGLAIVDQLARASGGSFRLAAADPTAATGRGLRAVISLPAASGADARP
jgi:signal transduction histidine kinase